MKRLILITAAILAVYLILTIVITDQSDIPETQTVSQTADTADGYTVSVLDGRIAVFRAGELCYSTDTPVASLPKADRTRLEKGIKVDSEKELKTLLEDYCS